MLLTREIYDRRKYNFIDIKAYRKRAIVLSLGSVKLNLARKLSSRLA